MRRMTTRPVIGVIGNSLRVENRFNVQGVGERSLRAVADVAGALPLMFAGAPDLTDIGGLLEVVDGVMLTGGRANVHPTRFRTEPHAKHEPYDEGRDDLALALIEVCVARGVPLFGVCRGLQEMNVAYGGTLHPEIRELPGRMNHRMPRLENGEIHPDPAVVFADRHDVKLVPGGAFATLLGRDTSASTRCMARASWSPAGASWWKAWPRTAPSRPSASPMRRALRWACSGMPRPTRRPTWSTAPCSRRSGGQSPRTTSPASSRRAVG